MNLDIHASCHCLKASSMTYKTSLISAILQLNEILVLSVALYIPLSRTAHGFTKERMIVFRNNRSVTSNLNRIVIKTVGTI